MRECIFRMRAYNVPMQRYGCGIVREPKRKISVGVAYVPLSMLPLHSRQRRARIVRGLSRLTSDVILRRVVALLITNDVTSCLETRLQRASPEDASCRTQVRRRDEAAARLRAQMILHSLIVVRAQDSSAGMRI
jgi:hypothetical protein